ncbi:hypothetical protein [Bradyrhizobium elkanii]|uniref:hypothetical protein n=1 Tax=Bradyrhizobium elkanii TaxID=29448 RepID=UPI002227ACB0|nr:hypothetical protein [Bradyrhizobium elkanii]MCW2130729.1 uncharacterized membrane protein HdeD (DUF308 family) [Bradyrhizobium elkanii]MCW2175885.1 uncharacterized membrane protein HdeD (DUF308 family) [Bradyrhizobium elkanii]
MLYALLGALYIVARFLTFEKAALIGVLLTLIVGASLVAVGFMRVFLAFSMKRATVGGNLSRASAQPQRVTKSRKHI